MEWLEGTKEVPAADADEWKDASVDAIFNYDLWEPGYTEVRHIKVQNEGTLAFNYAIDVLAKGEVTDLTEVIDVYYVDPAMQVTDRTQLVDEYKIGTLTEVLAGMDTSAKGILKAGENHTITIALKMQETAGNEYQGKSIGSEFVVQLIAAQATVEADSFDNQYDVNAESEYVFEVTTAEELALALLSGGNVVLENDIVTDETLFITSGTEVTLDLNGKTITGTMHKSAGAVISNNGTLTMTNGTVSSTAENGGSALLNSGTATVTDVTLNGAKNANGSWPSYTVNNSGILTITDTLITSYHGALASYGEGAIVTLNDSEINMAGIKGFTSHGIYTYNKGAVVVNSGTYVNHADDQNSTGGSVINGNVTVNGGTFSGRIDYYYGDPVLQGGTYSVKPRDAFIAEGYEAVEADGVWNVVAK